jgi:predicted TIM-barrel fold metal-dependent hydrolase
MITPTTALASLDSLGLNETARSCFLEDNARRVYGL